MPSPVEFNNSYAELPSHFYTHQSPTPVSNPNIIRRNLPLAKALGWDLEWLESDAAALALSGNTILPGSEPIATVYAGHQFGNWNPQLGDGRAILLGEVLDEHQQRFDIQLKGAGKTAYSRGGDGRSPLGPVLREYILSESMAKMSVPTTRSLAATMTGDPVIRESVEPGAVLTRVASSHIRVGTFEFFSSRGDTEAVRTLANHCMHRHFPEAWQADRPFLAFFELVAAAQARLISQWQQIGFIHGVMNTDNMLICGETVDYGPCAMMDTFDIKQVYSSIDRNGRYAYGNQPAIAQWNLSSLAQALLPLMDDNNDVAVSLAKEALDEFPEQYYQAYHSGFLAKLGLKTQSSENLALIESLLTLLETEQLDFTLCFRKLADLVDTTNEQDGQSVDALFRFPKAADDWLSKWQSQVDEEGRDRAVVQSEMSAINPVFIPRNHLVQAAIDAAEREGDLQPFNALMDVLETPYDYDGYSYDGHNKELEHYAIPPRPEQVVRQTFCGT